MTRYIVLFIACFISWKLAGQEQRPKFFFCDSNSILYNKLINSIKKRENVDRYCLIQYANLVDSADVDSYGIFRFQLGAIPSYGLYMFLKNKNSSKIHIVNNYRLKSLMRLIKRFIRKNNLSKEEQVRFFYQFALFYDDYIYVYGVGQSVVM